MDAIGVSAGGRFLPATAQADYASAQMVAIGSGVTQTTAFAAQNTVVILRSNVACWYSVGATAAAHTAGSDYLPAGQAWMLKIPLGATLAFIQDTVGGWVAVVPMAQPNPTTAAPLLLDKLSATATAAYSVRKLRNAYAGAAVNVRRSSDNATQDIGFAGNDFNVAAFNAFIGAGQGFVATWYDQSGNAHHATQATAANQPQLIASGTPGGKPTLLAAAGSTLLTATIPAAVIPLTFNAVAERTGNVSSICLMISQGASSPCMYFDSAPFIGMGNTSVDGFQGPSAPDNAFHSSFGCENGTSTTVSVDGTTTTGSISSHPGSTTLYLFSSNLSFGITGNMSEAMYFPGVVPAGDVATTNTDQHAYYGF